MSVVVKASRQELKTLRKSAKLLHPTRRCLLHVLKAAVVIVTPEKRQTRLVFEQ